MSLVNNFLVSTGDDGAREGQSVIFDFRFKGLLQASGSSQWCTTVKAMAH